MQQEVGSQEQLCVVETGYMQERWKLWLQMVINSKGHERVRQDDVSNTGEGLVQFCVLESSLWLLCRVDFKRADWRQAGHLGGCYGNTGQMFLHAHNCFN